MTASSVNSATPTAVKLLTAADVVSIDRALDRGALRQAGMELSALVDQRMQLSGGPHQEFELTRLIGKQSELQGDHFTGAAFLQFAADNAPTPADRLRLLPDLAMGLEASGSLADARRLYMEIVQANAGSLEAARLGLARIALIESPANVHPLIETLLRLNPPVDIRWEAELVDSRAMGILGDKQGQQAALRRAWVLAPDVSQRHGAVQRTAIDLALANQGSAISLFGLSLTDAVSPKALGKLRPQLPICGRNGITASDWMTVSIWRSPGTNNFAKLELIAASRAEVIPTFLAGLSYTGLQSVDDSPPSATPVTVRCRTGVSPDYIGGSRGSGIIPRWVISEGLYPAYTDTDERDAKINELQAQLAQREGRFGSNSPALLPILSQLIEMYGSNDKTGPDDLRRAVQLHQQQLTIGEQAKAPAAYLAYSKVWIALAQLALGESDPSLAYQQVQASTDLLLLDDQMAPAAARLATEALAENAPGSVQQKLALAEHVAKILAGKLKKDDPTLEALQLKIALFKRDTLGTPVGGSNRICQFADEQPKRLSGDITTEDYPVEAISAAMGGLTTMEFDITSDGTPKNLRSIVSSPPGLFDALTAEKLSAFRFAPAKFKRSPAQCVGYSQQVRWQLPK
ncbi:energy transducer TonB [Sphingobium sp.]|uniref:energy transducer TonB n=1 Tax=Sphingobium sp. TaxID=1912891 RepID=UPI0028BF1D47|nr:energy transducer TonB [Sphingobium sp.]